MICHDVSKSAQVTCKSGCRDCADSTCTKITGTHCQYKSAFGDIERVWLRFRNKQTLLKGCIGNTCQWPVVSLFSSVQHCCNGVCEWHVGDCGTPEAILFSFYVLVYCFRSLFVSFCILFAGPRVAPGMTPMRIATSFQNVVRIDRAPTDELWQVAQMAEGALDPVTTLISVCRITATHSTESP